MYTRNMMPGTSLDKYHITLILKSIKKTQQIGDSVMVMVNPVC